MTRRDLVGTKHFRAPNAAVGLPPQQQHQSTSSHRPTSIKAPLPPAALVAATAATAIAAPVPVTAAGAGAAMGPHVRIRLFRFAIYIYMTDSIC